MAKQIEVTFYSSPPALSPPLAPDEAEAQRQAIKAAMTTPGAIADFDWGTFRGEIITSFNVKPAAEQDQNTASPAAPGHAG